MHVKEGLLGIPDDQADSVVTESPGLLVEGNYGGDFSLGLLIDNNVCNTSRSGSQHEMKPLNNASHNFTREDSVLEKRIDRTVGL